MFTPCRRVLGLTHLQEHTRALVSLIRAHAFRDTQQKRRLAAALAVTSPEDAPLKMGSEKRKSKQQIGVQIVFPLLRVRQRFRGAPTQRLQLISVVSMQGSNITSAEDSAGQ